MTTRTIARREAIGRLALESLGVAAPVWLEAADGPHARAIGAGREKQERTRL